MAVILAALAESGANVQVARVATHGQVDVDLELRSHDGRRIVVNIKEENPA